MKKILIISYFFPPTGGGGVIRLTKFIKFLPDFGWRPYVLTIKNSPHAFADKTLQDEISNLAIIQRINYFEPLFWSKNRWWQSFLKYFLYPLILVPDAQLLWFLPALISSYRIIKNEKIKIIFTSSSSYTDHLV